MGNALKFDPDNVSYLLMHGMLALRNKSWNLAEKSLDRVVYLNTTSHKTNIAMYFLGRLDLHGSRFRRAADRFSLMRDVDPKLAIKIGKYRQDALNGKRRKLSPKKVSVMMQHADSFSY